MTTATVSEQAAVLALTRASPGEWFRTATVIDEVGSALAVLDGRTGFLPGVHHEYATELRSRVQAEHLEQAERLVEHASARGARLLTVLDAEYPANLRLIYNRPPFIWVRGRLLPDDFRAIAVVGTRQASGTGRASAARTAASLARHNVTVLSGLARGIDTADVHQWRESPERRLRTPSSRCRLRRGGNGWPDHQSRLERALPRHLDLRIRRAASFRHVLDLRRREACTVNRTTPARG